jgi:hypothetical protein
MMRGCKTIVAMSVLALTVIGCGGYADQRPDPNQLSADDAGLQSKDVISCTNQLVADLLSSPKLNQSPTQWTLAIGHMDDLTTDRTFSTNYDIFTESFRAAISEKAQGRIQLIENKETFHKLRDSEIEGAPADPYGQGGNAGTPAPAAINPDFILYGKAIDMPNRSTNFYLLEFNVVNSKTRTQDWSRNYTVKVAR